MSDLFIVFTCCNFMLTGNREGREKSAAHWQEYSCSEQL